jgi:hypothetical protein
VRGFDAYAKLYADSRKWLANGWVDYFAPQLYWPIDSPDQSFPMLLKWWSEQNSKGRNLVAGLDVTKINNKWSVAEIQNQISLTRRQRGVDGQIHWDMRTLMQNSGLTAALEKEIYRESALPPAMPWVGGTRPEKPRLRVEMGRWANTGPEGSSGSSRVSATWESNAKVWRWLLQTRGGGEWKTEILPGGVNSKTWGPAQPDVIALTVVDRNGNSSAPAVVEKNSR